MKKQPVAIADQGFYKSWTLEQAASRPGSLTILQAPSRIKHTVHHPDGRIVHDQKSTANNERN